MIARESMQEDTATSGTGTETQQTQSGATATPNTQNTATEGRTFTQEEVSRLIAKELKPYKEARTELEKIQKAQKEKEEAELSELEKLKRELSETSPFKERVSKLEETLATYLEAEIERIPEELRGLIPDELSVESKLAYIAKNRDRLMSQSNTSQGPRVTNGTFGKIDTLLEKAKQEAEIYCAGKSEEHKNAYIRRRHEQLKSGVSGSKLADIEDLKAR